MKPPLHLAVAAVLCAKSALCQETNCMLPAILQIHDQVQGDGELQDHFPVGTTLTFRCASGYTPNKIDTWNATCLEHENGSVYWDIGQHDCRPVSCGHPGDIPNGRLLDHVFVYPSRVRYQCNRGYRLVGEPILYCQFDTTWNAVKPECHIVECGTLEDITNGSVSLSGTVFGLTAEYSCSHGFKLVGNSARTCGADGRWTDESPHCLFVDCGDLEGIANAVLRLRETVLGSEARFNCIPGFKLVGNSTRICGADGKWSGESPRCEAICVLQPGPGFHVLRNTSYGSRVQWVVENFTHVTESDNSLVVKCVDGYRFTRQSLRSAGRQEAPLSCQGGVLAPPLPWCTEKPCRIPTLLPEGVEAEQSGEVPHGQQAMFRCKRGYTMQDADYQQHQPRCLLGRIDGRYPSCKPDDCRIGDLPPVENGQPRPDQSVPHGSSAFYECNPSLRLQPRGWVHCHLGQWLGTPPLCVPS